MDNSTWPAPPVDVISAIRCVMYLLGGIGKERSENLNYEIRSIDTILAKAVELCAAYGVVFVPQVLSERTEHITLNNRPWTDTYLEVAYKIYGPGGRNDFIPAGPVRAIGRDNADKGAGKALTQAYKQILNQVFMISDRSTDTDGITHEADAVQQGPTLQQLEWKEAMDGLTEILKLIPEPERAQCSAYIKQRYGDPLKMTLEQVREADKVAAGWPATAPFDPEDEEVPL
jgi:hypothetical protein